MKHLLLLLTIYIFPCTALGCAAYMIEKGHTWWGVLLLAFAWFTLPRFESRR